MRSAGALGVVVPAHDEEELLPACLEALAHALALPAVAAVPARVAIVLDDCRDRSHEAARVFLRRARLTGPDHRAVVVRIGAGNVGAARAAGFDALLPILPAARDLTWLATTDADSRVPARWLVHQLQQFEDGVDAWAGTVTVDDWEGRGVGLCRQYCVDYDKAPGHIHGTNLGFTAAAYLAAGGFAPMASGEDQTLWRDLEAAGMRTVTDPGCPVVTSARRHARAPQGFAALLNRLEAGDLEDAG